MFFVSSSMLAEGFSSDQLKVVIPFVTLPQDNPSPWETLWIFLLIFAILFTILLLFNLSGQGSKQKYFKKVLVFSIACIGIMALIVLIIVFVFRDYKFIDEQRADLRQLEETIKDDNKDGITVVEPHPEIIGQVDYLQEVRKRVDIYGAKLRTQNMQKGISDDQIDQALEKLEPITEQISNNNKNWHALNNKIDEKKEQLEQMKKEHEKTEGKIDALMTNDSALAEKNKTLEKLLARQLEKRVTFDPVTQVDGTITFGPFAFDFDKNELKVASLAVKNPLLQHSDASSIYRTIIRHDTFYDRQNEQLVPQVSYNEENGLFEFLGDDFRFIFLQGTRLLYLKKPRITLIKTQDNIIIFSQEGSVIIDPKQGKLGITYFFSPGTVVEYRPGEKPIILKKIDEKGPILRIFSHNGLTNETSFTYKDFGPQEDLRKQQYPDAEGNIFLEIQGKVIEIS